MQTRDVVLVVLDAAERRGEGQIGMVDVCASHLGDGHVKIFERVVLVALLEGADKEIVGKDVLFGEAGSRKSLEQGKEFLVHGVLALRFGKGSFVQPVVV